MAFNVNDTPQAPKFKENPPIPDGLYPARLARIIEIGDQEDKYGVKSRVVFAFTIPSQTIEIEGEHKQRMVMTFPLNKTSNPDSTTAKYVKALGGATWEDIIGKPCMVELEETVDKKGIARNNITNVTRPVAGMDIDKPDCDVFIFDFENPDKEVFDKLSDFRKDQIKQAVNYEGSAVEKMLEGGGNADKEEHHSESVADEDSPI